MAIWQWTEDFMSRRVMTVEADTEEEARRKMESGDWASEDEISLEAYAVVKDLQPIAD